MIKYILQAATFPKPQVNPRTVSLNGLPTKTPQLTTQISFSGTRSVSRISHPQKISPSCQRSL